jgi:hypothetical protein
MALLRLTYVTLGLDSFNAVTIEIAALTLATRRDTSTDDRDQRRCSLNTEFEKLIPVSFEFRIRPIQTSKIKYICLFGRVSS